MDMEKLIKDIEKQMSEPTNDYVVLWFSEAEYVLELLKEQKDISDALVDQCDRVRRLRKELADQPKIVRCKDCKHYSWHTDSCDHIGGIVSKDFFCADGERQDGR